MIDMLIKPQVSEVIQTEYYGVTFKIKLRQNLIFILGESADGKSFVYKAFFEDKGKNKLKMFNYTDVNNRDEIEQAIKSTKGHIFIIDNADLLLNDNLRERILLDEYNQYIIIGRDPRGLWLSSDNFFKLHFDEDTKTFTLVEFYKK